ncbi:hypothetical protein M3Y99_00801200 [Aphelenchoides fujianensis]|nr:hypothetical protein M3Y99_00801200 [Aphelenchoides fujianensis]
MSTQQTGSRRGQVTTLATTSGAEVSLLLGGHANPPTFTCFVPDRVQRRWPPDARRQADHPVLPARLVGGLLFARVHSSDRRPRDQPKREETSSIDSFVDVVDLKPAEERLLTQRNAIQEANRRASLLSTDEDVLAATVLQGPEATSPQRDLVRRTSTKATAEQLAPLRERCCSSVADGFKEFLRFDFANTELFKPTPTLLTPNSIGSRVWTRENNEKPRSPLANALCFKIASVAALRRSAGHSRRRAEPRQPAGRPRMIHVHSKDANNGGQLIRTDERQVEFPTGGPHSFEFLLEADERMRRVAHDPAAFLMITMLGRVVE